MTVNGTLEATGHGSPRTESSMKRKNSVGNAPRQERKTGVATCERKGMEGSEE